MDSGVVCNFQNNNFGKGGLGEEPITLTSPLPPMVWVYEDVSDFTNASTLFIFAPLSLIGSGS